MTLALEDDVLFVAPPMLTWVSKSYLFVNVARSKVYYFISDNAGINNYDSYVFPKEAPAPKARDDSFEALLLSVKAKLNSGKAATPAPAEAHPVAPSVPQDDHRM